MKAYNLDFAFNHKESCTYLSIHNRGLTKVPTEIFELPKLKELSLAQNQIKKLNFTPEFAKKITYLDLSGNQVDSFNFSIFTNLKHLILSNNQLGKIPRLPNGLISLDLSKNKIRNYNSLFKLKKLETLNLSNNLIKKFDCTIFKKLFHLNLSTNRIKKLEIKSLTNIQYLNISSNKITQILGLEQLPKLEVLNLSKNKLFTLPDSIFYIRKINLSGNQIESIQNSWFNSKELDLSKNKIKKIPLLTENYVLETLNIQNNRIGNFPKSISNLKKLFKLKISRNPITRFPIELIQLKKLGKLIGLPKNIQVSSHQFFKLCQAYKNDISHYDILLILNLLQKKRTIENIDNITLLKLVDYLPISFHLPIIQKVKIRNITKEGGHYIILNNIPISKKFLYSFLIKKKLHLGKNEDIDYIIAYKSLSGIMNFDHKNLKIIYLPDLFKIENENKKKLSLYEEEKILRLLATKQENNITLAINILSLYHPTFKITSSIDYLTGTTYSKSLLTKMNVFLWKTNNFFPKN